LDLVSFINAPANSVTLERGKVIVTQPLLLLAPADVKQGFSWNLEAASCGSQQQALRLCSNAADSDAW
jgi:hypothetical protein